MEFKRSNPIQLKIKAKTLAKEAVFIKDEEARATGRDLFRGTVRRTLSAYALEYNYPKPQNPLPAGIKANCVGDRIVRDVMKRYVASLTPEQLDRFQRRRYAAMDKRFLLRTHRIDVVRPEARATHLARAFLKEMPYADVEQKAYEFPLTSKIRPLIDAMVLKYGSGDRRGIQQRYEQWCQAGKTYHEEYWKILKAEQLKPRQN